MSIVCFILIYVILTLQKARQARIRMAKNASGAAFLNSKKRAEEMALAQDSGMELGEAYKEQDKFNMQHHHLLNCLENTTVSLIYTNLLRFVFIILRNLIFHYKFEITFYLISRAHRCVLKCQYKTWYICFDHIPSLSGK